MICEPGIGELQMRDIQPAAGPIDGSSSAPPGVERHLRPCAQGQRRGGRGSKAEEATIVDSARADRAIYRNQRMPLGPCAIQPGTGSGLAGLCRRQLWRMDKCVRDGGGQVLRVGGGRQRQKRQGGKQGCGEAGWATHRLVPIRTCSRASHPMP